MQIRIDYLIWSFRFADRYLAIIYPLKKRISKMCTINITLSIWLFSSLLSLPNIIFSKTEEEKFKNGHSKTICYLVWYLICSWFTNTRSFFGKSSNTLIAPFSILFLSFRPSSIGLKPSLSSSLEIWVTFETNGTKCNYQAGWNIQRIQYGIHVSRCLLMFIEYCLSSELESMPEKAGNDWPCCDLTKLSLSRNLKQQCY